MLINLTVHDNEPPYRLVQQLTIQKEHYQGLKVVNDDASFLAVFYKNNLDFEPVKIVKFNL